RRHRGAGRDGRLRAQRRDPGGRSARTAGADPRHGQSTGRRTNRAPRSRTMIARWPRPAPIIATLLYATLLLPPVRAWLEASMTLQMLVQIPLLIGVGYLLAGALPARLDASLARWNQHGITSLVLATLAGMFWMLPRSLDAAIGEPWMALAKFISVPLLIGLPLGLGWPRMGFVV